MLNGLSREVSRREASVFDGILQDRKACTMFPY
jgi:hypothetical protein